jgi:hypothetical protein
METLSKEAEAKISSALNAVIDLVNNGTDPTDAVVKAASDWKIPYGHIDLMVNAFNIGRSEAQRKGSSELFEKVSEFELADTKQVLDRMFPDTVKAAGVLAEETIISEAYKSPPRFLKDRARQQKLAAARDLNWSMGKGAPAPLPRDPSTAIKRAHSKLVDHKRTYEELRRAAQFQFDQTMGLFQKFSEYMRQPHAPLLATVSAHARVMYGDNGVKVCDQLDPHSKHTKQAAAGRIVDTKEALTLVGHFLDSYQSFVLAKTAHDKAEAERDQIAGDIARPFVPAAPEPGSVLGPCSTEKSAFLGGLFGTAIGSSMGRQLGNNMVSPTSDLQNSLQKKMSDPQHEATLRNIQTEAMLNDLMANDEVISGYDPNEVTGHFNEISQLSPRATNQSGLMRAMLRKRLQTGALDPYEIDMLLKIENGLKTRDNPAPGGVLGASAGVM